MCKANPVSEEKTLETGNYYDQCKLLLAKNNSSKSKLVIFATLQNNIKDVKYFTMLQMEVLASVSVYQIF
ncbi:hypothetical protein DSECCO2_335330 [anaerobic digester metagenome]